MNFQSFSQNSKGRDFVCADIHGHFSLLERQLSEVNFEPSEDRLFSLGDLIDRGDGSAQVLKWLAYPWFNAIQGNHERMLIYAAESGSEEDRLNWHYAGGQWAQHLTQQQLVSYYEAVVALPVAIEVEMSDGQYFGLVHADLPEQCDWQKIKQRLLNAPKDLESDPVISDMFWQRQQAYSSGEREKSIQAVKNIHHVFHGHSIIEEYRTITNRSFLDLGSYRTGRIGLIEPALFIGN
ncbi:metallophosphoesterase [Paraglaciecola aestuariivivens]